MDRALGEDHLGEAAPKGSWSIVRPLYVTSSERNTDTLHDPLAMTLSTLMHLSNSPHPARRLSESQLAPLLSFPPLSHFFIAPLLVTLDD